MAGQTLNKQVNDQIRIQGMLVKDAGGNPAQEVTVTLNVASGDPTGLLFTGTFQNNNLVITCLKPGTYQIQLTASNPSGSISSDAAGDGGATTDTLVVTLPPPATETWTYA